MYADRILRDKNRGRQKSGQRIKIVSRRTLVLSTIINPFESHAFSACEEANSTSVPYFNQAIALAC